MSSGGHYCAYHKGQGGGKSVGRLEPFCPAFASWGALTSTVAHGALEQSVRPPGSLRSHLTNNCRPNLCDLGKSLSLFPPFPQIIINLSAWQARAELTVNDIRLAQCHGQPVWAVFTCRCLRFLSMPSLAPSPPFKTHLQQMGWETDFPGSFSHHTELFKSFNYFTSNTKHIFLYLWNESHFVLLSIWKKWLTWRVPNQNIAGVYSDQKAMRSPGVYLETYKNGWGYGCETVYKTQTPGKSTKYRARIL